jgi:phenylacetate-coenzyme A ligase PaaK-like adenylate-forming protein
MTTRASGQRATGRVGLDPIESASPAWRASPRSDDMLIIRGVNVFPSQIEEQILACTALSAHYLNEITARSGSTR